jgi:dihydrodipicolinate synthase/N-acetylneuraminate lyase
MKDSGGDAAGVGARVAATPPGFMVFAGRSVVLAGARRAGAYGAICASANYAPELVLRTVVSADDTAQASLAMVAAAVEQHGVAGVKAAAEAAGLRAGPPRRPLRPVGPEALADIAAAVAGVTPAR